jgi:adenosylmethionine-8-amino-7-oxononanoate aminotransferase
MINNTPSRLGIQAFAAPPGAPTRPRIRHAEGIWFEDEAGHRTIDVSSGPVASNLGHGNPRVLAAMRAQMEAAVFAFPSQFESNANFALAEKLAALCGPGLDRAYLTSGGSEAIESAVRFCRQYAVSSGQGTRWKVISRMPSYHGNTAGALTLSGDPLAHEVFGPLLVPMPKIPAPVSYRVPAGHTVESYAADCAEALERSILAEGPETVLAFILEPVGGLATGALVATNAYYRRVREICSQYGVLLIYDEVMSGAGRTGRFLASDHWPDGRPDIVVLAKGVSAGYAPMGVVMVPEAMAEFLAARGGFSAGFTYYANPMACATAAAVLDEVMERDLIANAARQGDRMRAHLDAIAGRSRILGDVRGKGLLLAIEFVADKAEKRPIPPASNAPERVKAIGLQHGLTLYGRRTAGGQYGEWLMISPPLIVTGDEVDEIATRLEATLSDYETELAREGVI